jgi:hypothetical protein
VIRMAAEHKFKIGETVYLDPKLSSDAPGGAYQVIRRLSAEEGEFQYVVRSQYDNHQRVATEAELKAKRTFSPRYRFGDLGTPPAACAVRKRSALI